MGHPVYLVLIMFNFQNLVGPVLESFTLKIGNDLPEIYRSKTASTNIVCILCAHIVVLSNSSPDPVQVNSKCLKGHIKLNLYLRIKRSGPGDDYYNCFIPPMKLSLSLNPKSMVIISQ